MNLKYLTVFIRIPHFKSVYLLGSRNGYIKKCLSKCLVLQLRFVMYQTYCIHFTVLLISIISIIHQHQSTDIIINTLFMIYF